MSSVTLMILGKNLDPDVVSQELDLMPSQSWSKGGYHSFTRSDGSKRIFNSRHDWGGWKRYIAPKYKEAQLETQLQYWCEALQDKTNAITRLKSKGMHCVLKVFIATEATASMVLPETLQKSLANLGMEIEFSINMGD